MKRKLKGLYVPYVKWGLFYFLFANFISLVLYGNVDQGWKSLIDILLFRNVHILISPLWFLKSLFFSEIFFFCILYFVKQELRVFLTMLLLFTLGWYCSYYKYHLPFGINRELVTMFVLFLGYSCKKYAYNIGLIAYKPKFVAVVLLSCIVLLLVGALYGIKIDTMSCTFSYWLVYPFFTLVGVISLSCIYYYWVKIIGNKSCLFIKIISLLSKSSLSILALHFTCFMLLSIVLDLCHVNKETNLFNGFIYSSKFWWLYSIIGILGPLVLAKLCDSLLNRIKTAFSTSPIKL